MDALDQTKATEVVPSLPGNAATQPAAASAAAPATAAAKSASSVSANGHADQIPK
jgi:hypothetical protein